MDLPPSYYTATATARTSYPPLRGDIDADVCVVGGGIAGCSTALHLATRGYRVVLLEGQQIGWGASGRSGGQAMPGYACGQEKLIKLVGPNIARQMWQVSLDGLQLIRDSIAQYAIECDLHDGHLHAALNPRQREDLLSEQSLLQDSYGYHSLQFLSQEEVRALLATKRYCAGLLDRAAMHLHPLNYTLGLARAAQSSGVQIYEQSLATQVQHGEYPVVRTALGSVRSRYVALCCNAYIGDLEPALHARIMPIGTYIVATESLGEARMTALMRDNVAVSDANFILDYFRRSHDHRLLFGGRVSYSGLHSFRAVSATRKRMLGVFPQLQDVKIDHAWGGYVDITRNRAPDFGRLGANVYYLQGFSGQGIALTGIAGRLIADAICGQAERFDLFTQLKHRTFPGGAALRTPALVLAMLWFRLRDIFY